MKKKVRVKLLIALNLIAGELLLVGRPYIPPRLELTIQGNLMMLNLTPEARFDLKQISNSYKVHNAHV